MKQLPHLARALAFVSLAALMAGCQTTAKPEITGSVPNDYRLRHPIAVREKAQTLTVFVGDARGGLTATQRAEVGAIASSWRREATGGIVIEMPVGAPNERVAAGVAREIRSLLASAGVPHHSIEIRPVPHARSRAARHDPRQLSEDGGRNRPVRAVAGRHRPDLRPGLCLQPAALESRLLDAAQSCGASRQPGRSGSAARRDARDGVAPRDRAWRSTARAKATATQYPDANKGKISDIGQ